MAIVNNFCLTGASAGGTLADSTCTYYLGGRALALCNASFFLIVKGLPIHPDAYAKHTHHNNK